MSYTITVEPSGRHFEARESETILAAALHHGVGLPYGCKDGACGSCKCRLLDGRVVHGPHQEKALSAAEEAQGYVLTCCATAQSDVVLESRQVTAAGMPPIRKMPARVARLERLSHDVMRVQLQLPAFEGFAYLAGQYLDVLLRDGTRRSYSMANAPHTLMQTPEGAATPVPMVEFHIRHMPGGVFTDHVFGGMKEREILRVEGPQGSFYLRDESDRPMILLASGTGFAPIKALIEHLQFVGNTRAATLYWGGRRPADLYLDNWVRAQLATTPWLRYVPVVSDALPEDRWTGRTGYVHRAVLEDTPDLSGYQVYACGAPVVIESARRDYTAAGLPTEAFFADAFITEADKAAS